MFKLLVNMLCLLFMAGISTFTVQQYFQIFFKKKKKTLKEWGILAVYFLWQMISMQSMPNLSAWIRLGISVGFVLMIGYNVGGKWFQKSVFSIIYNAVWMLCELLTGCFFMVIGVDFVLYNTAGSIISKLFFLLIIKMLQIIFSQEGVRKLYWYYNAILMFLPVGSMFVAANLFIMSSKIHEEKYIKMSIVSLVTILIVNITIFQIYIKLSDNLELKRKNFIYQLEIELYNEHIKEKESTMLEFRRAKHDLKHQMIYLLELSENKEYEKLDKQLKKLIDREPLEGVTIANSDNLMMDALINYKYSIAKSYGISFGVKLEVPTSLPFEDADLCVVLGNALDNAIEACLRGTVSNPYVELKIKYDCGNLIVIVENSYDGKIKKNHSGKVVTRKEKAKNHGIGIDSIQRTVEKHHGFFKVESDGNVFRLKIILYSSLVEKNG